MKKRKRPLGYEMKMGVNCINEKEAGIVRKIFAAYANGMSYSMITNWLNEQMLPYREPGVPWNKNIIARILQDERYVQDENYPSIISAELFQKALNAKPEVKRAVADIKMIRKFICCPACQSSMTKNRGNTWICKNCEMGVTGMTEEWILNETKGLIKYLIANPVIVEEPPGIDRGDITNELAERLDNCLSDIDFDEQEAIGLALMLSSVQFEILGSEKYESIRIRSMLLDNQKTEQAISEIIPQIVQAVLLQPDKTVGLILQNRQIIERR